MLLSSRCIEKKQKKGEKVATAKALSVFALIKRYERSDDGVRLLSCLTASWKQRLLLKSLLSSIILVCTATPPLKCRFECFFPSFALSSFATSSCSSFPFLWRNPPRTEKEAKLFSGWNIILRWKCSFGPPSVFFTFPQVSPSVATRKSGDSKTRQEVKSLFTEELFSVKHPRS